MAEKFLAKRPETGWGEKFQALFKDDVRVRNLAKNGRSTRTFISEGLWDRLLSEVREGDYVFLQFGHNDASREKVDRYTPPDDYKRNLARFVADVRARKAYPVLMTPVMRRRFDAAGVLQDTHGAYPDLVRALGRETGAPVLDLHRESGRVLSERGADGSVELFLQLKPGENSNYPEGIADNTHFSPKGAAVMAEEVAKALRTAGVPLAGDLR